MLNTFSFQYSNYNQKLQQYEGRLTDRYQVTRTISLFPPSPSISHYYLFSDLLTSIPSNCHNYREMTYLPDGPYAPFSLLTNDFVTVLSSVGLELLAWVSARVTPLEGSSFVP